MTNSSAPRIPDRPDSPGAARALGEFALRVEDFETMREFYRDVVGLGEPIGDFGFATFFSLGESHAGHEAVFALFDRMDEADYEGLDQTFTTLDHLSFTIAPADFDAEVERLRGFDLDLDFAYHEWVQWRSLYFADPEGNRIELVCRDPEGAAKNEQYETTG